MSYLVCYNCDIYYEFEDEEEANEFQFCECGFELVYFENLDDYYIQTDEESSDESLSQPYRESLANDFTHTEKKALQYQNVQDTGKLLFFAGIAIIFIGLITGLIFNFMLFILVLIGGFLAFYGNSISLSGKKRAYSWEKGLEGENIVLDNLNTLPKDYFVYHDVNLPGKGGNIDHIVIGPTGIFVIETKNYSGKYRIKGNRWLYYKKGNYREIKNNPGVQVRRNTVALIDFLNKKGISTKGFWINSLVAFMCNDFKVLETPKSYKILLPKTVP